MEDDAFPFQAEYEAEMRRVREQLGIEVGDIYEDCAWHPVLCVAIDYDKDDIKGISLIDGTYPRSCSLRHCGVRKLAVEEAWDIRLHGPSDPEARANFGQDSRWWRG